MCAYARGSAASAPSPTRAQMTVALRSVSKPPRVSVRAQARQHCANRASLCPLARSLAVACPHRLFWVAGSGQAFVHDPRVSAAPSTETKAKIRLKSVYRHLCAAANFALPPPLRGDESGQDVVPDPVVCCTGSKLAIIPSSPCPACSTSRTRKGRIESRSSRYFAKTVRTPPRPDCTREPW